MEDYLPHLVALRSRLLVLVDADPGGALDEAEALLAPLDANLELEPYALPCVCIEMRADDVSCESAGEALYQRDPEKSLYISSLWQANPNSITDEEERKMEEQHEDFTQLMQFYRDIYLRNLLPYPDCEACDGTGVRRGLHNPEGRWFSWEVVEDAEGFGGDGRVAARELSLTLGKHRFSSLLTPDGRWLDRDFHIGPTAEDEEETEEEHDRRWRSAEDAWEREVRGQLREHAGCTAVSVRCVAAVGSVDEYVSGFENSTRRPWEG